MVTNPPATAEEAIRQYQELRAKNEAKQEQDLHARISLTAGIEIDPINKQVLRRSLYPKIEIDIPPNTPDLLDALHKTQATLQILIGEFMAAHLLKTPTTSNTQATSTTLKTEPVLEWIQSKNNPTVEFIPTDRPGVQYFHELAKQGEKGYWLNQEGTLIFRYKKATRP